MQKVSRVKQNNKSLPKRVIDYRESKKEIVLGKISTLPMRADNSKKLEMAKEFNAKNKKEKYVLWMRNHDYATYFSIDKYEEVNDARRIDLRLKSATLFLVRTDLCDLAAICTEVVVKREVIH
jgi:hypothetical protein